MSRWIGGWGTIVGTLIVTQDLTIGDDLVVTDDASVGGDLLVSTDAHIVNDLLIDGELQGARVVVQAGKLASGQGYLKGADSVLFSATAGYILPRAGSVVGVSIFLNCTTGGLGKSADVQVLINNGVTLALNVDFGAGADEYQGHTTQARGIDTFTAGNRLGVKTVENAGAVIEKVQVLVELQFDT